MTQVGAWLDSSKETAPFTTFVTYHLDPDDPNTEAQIDPSDTRRIVFFPSLLGYGPTSRSRNGYYLRADAVECWNRLKPIVEKYRDRIVALWLADEPDAVACGDQDDSDGLPCGTPGDRDWDPNLYNPILTDLARMIAADFPRLPIGVNFASVPASLRVPDGITLVGLEGYGVDWLANLRSLEDRTTLPLVLMPPAFVQGDPRTQDAIVAQRLRDEFAYAKTDPRVVGVYWFLWCCDDQTTGTKDFYAAGGVSLPLTQAAVRASGRNP